MCCLQATEPNGLSPVLRAGDFDGFLIGGWGRWGWGGTKRGMVGGGCRLVPAAAPSDREGAAEARLCFQLKV